MSIFDKLKSIFSAPGGAGAGDSATMIYVRGHRCKENLSTRINLNNDLSEKDEGGYLARKILVGTGKNRCFERVEVILHFDERKNLIDREISGGVFITAEAFESQID